MAAALLTAEHVACKGQGAGCLVAHDGFLEWLPSSATGARVTIDLSNVKQQRVSKDTKPKVQMQIMMKDESATVFIFTHTEGKERQLRDRSAMSDLLANLLPRYRKLEPPSAGPSLNAVNGHVTASSAGPSTSQSKPLPSPTRLKKHTEEYYKQKQKLLENNKVLLTMYTELVTSGVISAEEFWEHYASTGDEKSELATSSDGCNDIHFNLSRDMMLTIFTTYPSVKKKHLELVPAKKTEKEFWIEFFQSQYFHRQRIGQPPGKNEKDIFLECARLDDREYNRLVHGGPSTSRADLGSVFENPPLDEGFGNISRDELESQDDSASSDNAKLKLLRSFNQHSVRVLRSTLGEAVKHKKRKHEDSSKERDLASKQAKHVPPPLETDELLADIDGEPSNTLDLHLDNYFYGATEASTDRRTSWSKADSVRWLSGLQRAVDGLPLRPNPQLARLSVDSMSRLDTLCASSDVAGSSVPVGYPHGDFEKLRSMYDILNELLRHFWACFPVRPSLEAKLKSVHEALLNFKMHRLDTHIYNFPHHDMSTVQHMYKLIDLAGQKYSNYMKKRKPRP